MTKKTSRFKLGSCTRSRCGSCSEWGGDEDEAANALGVSDRKASYEVWILEVGPGKLKVVRAVHELLGGSIKTARDIVQNACDYPPQAVKGYDTMEEAKSVVESLEYEGAKCEIREVYQ